MGEELTNEQQMVDDVEKAEQMANAEKPVMDKVAALSDEVPTEVRDKLIALARKSSEKVGEQYDRGKQGEINTKERVKQKVISVLEAVADFQSKEQDTNNRMFIHLDQSEVGLLKEWEVIDKGYMSRVKKTDKQQARFQTALPAVYLVGGLHEESDHSTFYPDGLEVRHIKFADFERKDNREEYF